MPRKSSRNRRKLSPDDYFVQLYKTLLREPAWVDMTPGARILYIEVKSFYNGSNNGELFLSVRDAAKRIGCSSGSAFRWFHELIEHGFLRVARGGSLGVDGAGEARCWLLTEIGYRGTQPTRDYKNWQPPKSKARTHHRHSPLRSAEQFGGDCVDERNSCIDQGNAFGPKSTASRIDNGHTYISTMAGGVSDPAVSDPGGQP